MSDASFPAWELDVSFKHLKDIRLRRSLADAMASGWPIGGQPGDCDLTLIATDALASSCALSEELGVTTTLAENMLRTSRLLIELRGAWADRNFSAMASVFERAKVEQESGRLDSASEAELMKAREDMEERMLRIALKDDGIAQGAVTEILGSWRMAKFRAMA